MNDDCDAMRKTIQERQDGPLSADDVRALEAHLDDCPACRDYERGIETVRTALRSMPLHRFPDAALEEVLDRTVRARRSRLAWRPLAAAAAFAVVLLGVFLLREPGTGGEPGPYSRQEVEQAAEELKLVLAYTAQTVRAAEQTAVGGVLANEMSPALQRIPIVGGPASEHRRSGT